MSDVAILIPTRGRSDRLEKVVRNASHPDANVYLIMNSEEAREVPGARTLASPGLCSPPGAYARAINYGYRRTVEPLLFTGADDLRFWPGWLEKARACLSDQIGVVGTNDMAAPYVVNGDSATHWLTDRRYLDERGGVFDEGPGSFLWEGYFHHYCDTEFIELAKRRGVWAPCLTAKVEHLHPAWGKGKVDDIYRCVSGRVNEDMVRFITRSGEMQRLAAT